MFGSKNRVTRLLATAAVLFAGAGVPVLFAAGLASAATCTTGTPCTITGTATLTGGTLSATTPDSLSWAATLNGLTQSIVDTTAADQILTVDDATGSASGWNVSVAATTFTSTSATLPDGGTFSVTGSITSAGAATAPTAACTGGGTGCTLPDDTGVTYPVAITTAATGPTASVVYEAAAGTGVGSIDIGGSTATDPVGWWLTLPANTAEGSYTSTVTISLGSGP